MEGRKGVAVAVLLALVALGFFTGQCSARGGKSDIARLIQLPRAGMHADLGAGVGRIITCEKCLCGALYHGPPGECICADVRRACRPTCRDCGGVIGSDGRVCRDPVARGDCGEVFE